MCKIIPFNVFEEKYMNRVEEGRINEEPVSESRIIDFTKTRERRITDKFVYGCFGNDVPLPRISITYYQE